MKRFCMHYSPRNQVVRRARGFESHPLRHVGASFISLAPTYFISRSALIPLLLLSDRDSLRWIRGRFLVRVKMKISGLKPPDTSEQALYRLQRVFLSRRAPHFAAPPLQLRFAPQPLAALPPYGSGVPLCGCFAGFALWGRIRKVFLPYSSSSKIPCLACPALWRGFIARQGIFSSEPHPLC